MSEIDKPRRFTVRLRNVQARTATGLYRGPEVQVVEGRKVVARFDTSEQARNWINRQAT